MTETIFRMASAQEGSIHGLRVTTNINCGSKVKQMVRTVTGYDDYTVILSNIIEAFSVYDKECLHHEYFLVRTP
jgi:hypothetical protein